MKINRIQPFNHSINFGGVAQSKPAQNFATIEKSDYPPFIKEHMKRISSCNVEHGLVFTKEGALIGREFIGDKHTLPINEELDELIEKHPGCIVIHNHPHMCNKGQALPVTFADAFYIGCRGASEIVATHPDGTYSSAKWLPGENSEINYDGIDLCRDIMTMNLFNDFDVKLYNKYGHLRDELWRKYAEKLGVIYTNTYNY